MLRNILCLALLVFAAATPARAQNQKMPNGLWEGYDGEWLHVSEQLIALAERDRGSPTLNLEEWPTYFPQGGFHLDVAQRSLSFWWTDPWGTLVPIFLDDLAVHWPGWSLHPLTDNYEAHVRLTQERLHIPVVPTDQVFEAIQAMLTIIKWPITDTLKQEILDNAIARWREHRMGHSASRSRSRSSR